MIIHSKKAFVKVNISNACTFSNTQFMRKAQPCIYINECDTEMTIAFLCWPICDFRDVQSIDKHDTRRYNGPTVQQYLATSQNWGGRGGEVSLWRSSVAVTASAEKSMTSRCGKVDEEGHDNKEQFHCHLTAARLCYGWVILTGYRLSGSIIHLTCSSWFSLISLIVAEYDW